MAPITHSKPAFSEKEVMELCGTLFDLVIGEVIELPSERDQNFLVVDETMRKYVVKIADSNEDREVLAFQNEAMLFIHKKTKVMNSFKVPVPLPVKNSENAITQVKSSTGGQHFLRLVEFIDGIELASFKPHNHDNLFLYGKFIGELTNALQDFDHMHAQRDFYWDLANATEVISEYHQYIGVKSNQRLVSKFVALYKSEVVPLLPKLPESIIHNDCNDNNVIVSVDQTRSTPHFGIIDFGDMVYSKTVYELAIALAYGILGKEEPIMVIKSISGGYLQKRSLSEEEIDSLYLLTCMRLCMSVSISSYQITREPDNQYLLISQAPAFAMLEQLSKTHHRFIKYILREAAGMALSPKFGPLISSLNSNQNSMSNIFEHAIERGTLGLVDLSVDTTKFDFTQLTSMEKLRENISEHLQKNALNIGIGRYCEVRLVNTSDQYTGKGLYSRNTHLGVDLFTNRGTKVFTPIDGKIHSFQNNKSHGDYGPTIILEHERDGFVFYTLYGHLSVDSLSGIEIGDLYERGKLLGTIGGTEENGGWSPHLHFQIILDIFDYKGDYPGVVDPRNISVWQELSPNPNLILNLPIDIKNHDLFSIERTQVDRQNLLGKALSLSYSHPLKIVRGYMHHLFDFQGVRYLDAVNNVPHVGHSNPEIVKKMANQAAVLNTNTRYLHDTILHYAQALLSTLAPEVQNDFYCYFTNSGSEANELALRLAKTYTQSDHIVVLEGAYHGNTQGMIDISPYKFNGPGGQGAPSNVTVLPMPYPYRGKYKGYSRETSLKYTKEANEILTALQNEGITPVIFMSEPIMGVGGQIIFPDGYLEEMYKIIRKGGGICISDEVQIGFGRVGTHFWGFQTQKVLPDIITLGKPIGNGHPIGAVLVKKQISNTFDTGMEYFNTFGGNPVSCAVGLSVLEYIKEHRLQQNAQDVGRYFISQLESLQSNHQIIGDVRGKGLFIGVEFVKDRDKKIPAPNQASYVVNRLKDLGILVSTDGPDHNVIKIKPPIIFSKSDVDYFMQRIKLVFQDTYLNC